MSTGRTFPTGVGAPILLEHIKITRRVRPLQRHPHVSSIAPVEAVQRIPDSAGWLVATRADITARRGRNIATVAVARRLLTLVYYGLRDGHIRALTPTEAKAAHDTAGAA